MALCVKQYAEKAGLDPHDFIVHRYRAANAAGATAECSAQAHQPDDVAGVGVHFLLATKMIRPRMLLDVAEINDVPEKLALVRLDHWPAYIRTEPEIDTRHIIGGVTPAG